jgi:hypothetical protein
MKKQPKKLRLNLETLQSLELGDAAAALADISGDCQTTLVNIVCKAMP